MSPAKGKYPGVAPRGDQVRIWFPWQGKRQFEEHPAPNTPAGLKRAAQDRARIVSEIKLGTFDYAHWFPDSENAETGPTFEEYAHIWLKRKRPEIAKSTLTEYVQKLNCYWLPELSQRQIQKITPGDLIDISVDITVASKTYNDSLTPLRQVFEAAIDDKIIESNPASRLKSRRRGKKPDPDPLTVDEQDCILGWLKDKDPHWWAYFAIAFDTGMRTSELIALTWSRVDIHSGYMRVDQAYVRQETKGTKTTSGERDIEMGSLTREALAYQKKEAAVRKLSGASDDLVFWDRHGRIIIGDKPPRLVWDRVLNAVGIRHRKAYATRHTFATTALMNEIPVGWISKQLGHSSIRQTMDTYATWIEKLDKGSERAKLDRAKIIGYKP